MRLVHIFWNKTNGGQVSVLVLAFVSSLSGIHCVSSNAKIVDLQRPGGLVKQQSSTDNDANDHYWFPKCCEKNEVLNLFSNRTTTCRASPQNLPFSPTLYSTVLSLPTRNTTHVNFVYTDVIVRKNCSRKLRMFEKFCIRFEEDGSLVYRDKSLTWVKLSRENYCIDRIKWEVPDEGLPYPIFDKENMYGFLACPHPPKFPDFRAPVHTAFGWGFAAASIFLLATFWVYAILWKEQTIQGWITMSHSGTMFLWYFFLGSGILLNPNKSNRFRRTATCRVVGVLQHFFVLSNYCWLTVNSFSLFWTFRKLTVSNPYSKNVGQYLAFAGFAWGLPVVFVVASVVLDQIYSYDPCNDIAVPQYGFEICYISHDALGPYHYYPIVVVMSLNFIFFLITAYKLYGHKKVTSILASSGNLKKTSELFILIGKMFLLMGFTWILDFTAWLQSRHASSSQWYFALACCMSILQVVPIFIIYMSKPSLVGSLKKKYPKLKLIWRVLELCGSCFCNVSGRGKCSNTHQNITSKGEQQGVSVETTN